MTQPQITETSEYEPTDSEMVQTLGWDDAPEEDAPPAESTTPEPQPAPEPAPQPAPEPQPAAQAPTPEPPTPQSPQAPQDAFQKQQEEQVQRQQDQQVAQHIEGQAGQYMNNLVAQGYDQQTAYQQAKVWAEGQWNRWETTKAQDQAKKASLDAGRYRVSQQYGVPMEQLQGFDSEGAMEQHAKLYKEIHQVRQEVARPAPAPVQQFDSNRMAASNSPDALKWRYASDPNFQPTEEQFKAMGLG